MSIHYNNFLGFSVVWDKIYIMLTLRGKYKNDYLASSGVTPKNPMGFGRKIHSMSQNCKHAETPTPHVFKHVHVSYSAVTSILIIGFNRSVDF